MELKKPLVLYAGNVKQLEDEDKIPLIALELVKADGTEVDGGTEDEKYLTAKAVKDSSNIPSVSPSTIGNILVANGTKWVSGPPGVANGPLFAYAGYSMCGVSAQQQLLNVVVNGANIYMETESTENGDIDYIFDEQLYTLNCTSGPGNSGMAQVALTPGTETHPQINFVYVVPNGANTAILVASTFLPTGTFAWHSIVVLQTAALTAANGPFSLQRNTEALKHSGRGQLSYIKEKLRWMGAKYASGISQTLSVNGDNINLSTTSGVVFELHRQIFPAMSVATNGIYIANASGSGTLTRNQKVMNLADINETASGVTIGKNKYYSIAIWATIASASSGVSPCKLFANLPTDVYQSPSELISDSKNFDVRTADYEYNNTAFLICRITLQRTQTSGVVVGDGIYSLLGRDMGYQGGGAGSVALHEFDDDELKIYDTEDPTKITVFEGDNISTGNTRTIFMADRDIDLTNVPTTEEKALLARLLALGM